MAEAESHHRRFNFSSTTTYDENKEIDTDHTNNNHNMDSRKRVSIADFVDKSFASFDRFYGITRGNTTNSTANNNDSSVLDEESTTTGNASSINSKAIEVMKKPDVTKSVSTTNTTKTDKNDKTEKPATEGEENEEEIYAAFTYLALLTSLYLPLLLFLWIRRNVFGTASIVRSLFLGHVLRFGLAFSLLPPSTTKSIVPTRLWNAGVALGNHFEKVLHDKRTQKYIPRWLHILLGLNNNLSSAGGTSSGAVEKDTWPPPAFLGLALFTLGAFVVHPDGLTWIMLGSLRDGLQSVIDKTLGVIRDVRRGNFRLAPESIVSSISVIIIFFMIVEQVFFSKKKVQDSSPHRERLKQKHKKGKKTRGRHHHVTSNSSRGKSRGVNYRTTKDIDDGVSGPSSRSPSPSERSRTESDMENTTVSAISDCNVPNYEINYRTEKRTTSSTSIIESPSDSDGTSRKENTSQSKTTCDEDIKSITSDPTNLKSTKSDANPIASHKGGRGKRAKKSEPKQKPQMNSSVVTSKDDVSASQRKLPQEHSLKSIEVSSEHISSSPRKKIQFQSNVDMPLDQVDKVVENRYQFSQSSQGSHEMNRKRSNTEPIPVSTPVIVAEPDANVTTFSRKPLQLSPHETSVPMHHTSNSDSSLFSNPIYTNSYASSMTPPAMQHRDMMSSQYHSHAGSGIRDSYEKMELASLLSKVGLVGGACSELLVDLSGVDALATLTDTDYDYYCVTPMKRQEIRMFLEYRKNHEMMRRSQQQLSPMHAKGILRPPPGLQLPIEPSGFSGSSPFGSTEHSANVSSSSLNSSLMNTHVAYDSNFSKTSHHDLPQCTNGRELRNNNPSDVDSYSVPLSLPPVSYFNQTAQEYSAPMSNDDEIEANLRELGGRMVGSILDF